MEKYFFANCGKNSIVFAIEWISKYFSLFLLLILSFASLASSRSFLDRCCGTHFHWIQFYLFDTFSVLFYFLFQFFSFGFALFFLLAVYTFIYLNRGPSGDFTFGSFTTNLALVQLYTYNHTRRLARTLTHSDNTFGCVCTAVSVCVNFAMFVCARAIFRFFIFFVYSKIYSHTHMHANAIHSALWK